MSVQVVRMALQVVSILSSSKGALEADEQDHSSSAQTAATDHKGSETGSKATASSKSQLSRFGKGSSSSTTKHTGGGATTAGEGGGGGGGEGTQLNKYFRTFLVELLRMFETDRTLLETKGSFVIR